MLFSRSCSSRSVAVAFLGTNLALQGAFLQAQNDCEMSRSQEHKAAALLVEDNSCVMIGSAAQLVKSSSQRSELVASAQQLIDSSKELARGISQTQQSLLSELVAIRNTMEQSVLLSAVVQLDLRSDNIPRSDNALLTLYEALLPKLLEGITRTNPDRGDFLAELAKHYEHILIALRSAPADVRADYRSLLERYFVQTKAIPAYEVYGDLDHFCGQDSALLSRFLVGNFADIAESFSQRVGRLAVRGLSDTERFDYLLTTYQRVRRDLTESLHRGYLSQDLMAQRLEQAHTIFAEPLAPHLVTIWKLDYEGLAHFNRSVGRDTDLKNPLSIEASRYYTDRSTQSVMNFLSSWAGDRSIVGNTYFDALGDHQHQYQHRDVAGFLAIHMLPLLAPDPTRKDYIIDDLRRGLLWEGRQRYIGHTSDRPIQVARILALSLISDHLYFATPANTSYDAKLAISLMRGLKDSGESLEPYRLVLTPSQLFLLELFRVAKGGAVASTIPWATSGSEVMQSHLHNRAATTLRHLMFSLYECQPLTALQERSEGLGSEPIATPRSWGTGSIFPPTPGSEKLWKESLQNLFSYGDLIFEDIVESPPQHTGIFFISSQISDVAAITWRRGGSHDRIDRSRPCQALATFRELYSEPGNVTPGERGGSFFSELKRAIMELYTSRAARETPASRNQAQQYAHRYVDTLQRLSIAEFLVRELANFHQSESSFGGPARRNLTSLCEQFGFIERDSKIREILELSSASAMLKASNEYAEELTESLSRFTNELGL